MADWPPLKNSSFTVTFPVYDADGDVVTGAAGLDSERSIDGGTFTDCTNEATEIATSSGIYTLALTAAEMNGDIIATITKTTTTGAKTAVNVMYTVTRQLADLAYPTTSGRSIDVLATGEVGIDLDNVSGTLSDAEIETITVNLAADQSAATIGTVNALGAQAKLDVNAEADTALSDYDPPTNAEMEARTIAAASYFDPAADTVANVTAVGSVSGAVGSVTGAVGSVGAGGITSTSFAADALNAAALAADAANEIADALLSRDIDQVEATMALHSLGTAVLKAVARIVDDAGTLKLYRTDGTTLHMSQTITTDASADPIDELTVGV